MRIFPLAPTLLSLLLFPLPGAASAQVIPCSQLCLPTTGQAQCETSCNAALRSVCLREGQTCQQACDSSWPAFCQGSFADPAVCLAQQPRACLEVCDESCPDAPKGFENLGAVAAKMLEDVEAARWKLTPGFDVETGVNLSATSRVAHAFDLGGTRVDNPWCSFAVFDGKGELSSAQDAKNHAEAALSSTVAYCRRRPGTLDKVPLVVGLTGDFRNKWGKFEEGTGAHKKTVEGNQSLFGAGLTVLTPSAPAWVKGFQFTAAYYTVVDSDGTLSAPKELDVEHLQARLNSRLVPFGTSKTQILKDLAFVLDGRASWPMEGADKDVVYYQSVALEIGKGKTAGTVRWENGKEVGFQYDKKLVVGVIFRLLGLEKD
jgi:hypothetical protein